MLSNPTLAKQGKTIDMIFEACANSEKKLKSLLLGERLQILLEIKIASHGEIYSCKMMCQQCKTQFDYDVNLRDDLKIKKYNLKTLKQDDKGNFLFEFTLPSTKHKIVARLLTGTDERWLEEIEKEYSDEKASRNLMIKTNSIDGNPIKKVGDFKKWPSLDSVYFRQKYEEHEGGVYTNIDVTCPHCNSTAEAEVPIADPSFFFPKVIKKS